jgi:putative PIN family toxin of toxin-antitoxin system
VKVVLDANVLLAAYGFGGTCFKVVELCLVRHDVFISEYILDEFKRHLQGKFHATEGQANTFAERFRAAAICVSPAEVAPDACPDPDDLPVLGTLQAANADCLITGDKALLRLKSFSGHLILSPRDFLNSQG